MPLKSHFSDGTRVLIFRYLIRETLKSQSVVFLVLMAIFLTKNFVDVLADATNGDIPASLVLVFLALSTPVLAGIVLPLSLFLGILLAHGRLYVDSEMAVFHACGISEWYITRVMLLLAFVMALLTSVITLWLAPLSVENQYQLEEQIVVESGLTSLIPGRFQETANQKAVIFVHEITTEKNQLQRVFLAQHENEPSSQDLHIVYAQSGGVIEDADGSQKLILDGGTQYEGKHGQKDFHIVEFEEYQIQIAEQKAEQKRRRLSAYPTSQLISDKSLDAIAELQWRIAIPLSLPFLVLIAVPLSAVDRRHGRFGKMFPALMLYMGYFLLLMAGRKVLEEGKISPQLGLWWVHGLVFFIGGALISSGRSLGVSLLAKFRGAS